MSDSTALSAENVRSADDFVVRVEEHDWERQLDRLIELDATGRLRAGEVRLVGVEDGVRRDVTWHVATRLEPDAVERARAIVANPDFLALEKSYSVPRLADGVLITLEVTAAAERQRVRCHNRVPEPALRLITLMRDLEAEAAGR